MAKFIFLCTHCKDTRLHPHHASDKSREKKIKPNNGKRFTRNPRNALDIVGTRTGSYLLEHTCKQMAAMQTIYNDLNKRTQARHEKAFNQVGSPS